MNNVDGIVELDYFGKIKRIEFNLNISPGYGGLPMMTIKDKNNHHHSFTRGRNGEWNSLVVTPKWPQNFIDILYFAFEVKYQEICRY